MKPVKRLTKKSAIYTPKSQATVLINYSESTRILEVEFTNKKIYQYLQVEVEQWLEYKKWIDEGASSGEFVNKNIKPFYKFVEIDQ